MLQPFSFYVRCFQISYLFAGKMHALLFRKWKNNIKGQDWYDFEWYIRKGITLDLPHFIIRANDSGDIVSTSMTELEFKQLLNNRIDELDFKRAKDDIKHFISDPKVLNIWSADYFHQLVDLLLLPT